MTTTQVGRRESTRRAVWRLHLAGGAMAFGQGRMGVDQILAVRSGPHDLPAVRAW